MKKTIKLALQYPGLLLLPAFSFWTFAGLNPTCCNKRAVEFGVSPLLRIIHWFLFHLGFFIWWYHIDPEFAIPYLYLNTFDSIFKLLVLRDLPVYIALSIYPISSLIFLFATFLLDKLKCSCCCSFCLPLIHRTTLTYQE